MYSVQICPVMKWDAQSSRREASISAGDGKLLPEDAWAAGIGVENPRFTSHCPWNYGFLYVYILSVRIYIYIHTYTQVYIHIHKFFKCICVCFLKRERESYADVGSIQYLDVLFPCMHIDSLAHITTHTHSSWIYQLFLFSAKTETQCVVAPSCRRSPAPKRPYVHFWLAPQAIFLGAVVEMHSQWRLVLY